ncbi:MAG: anhydro-N-acetylmuramic acid kinase [Alphaproteobacteria bacterium]
MSTHKVYRAIGLMSGTSLDGVIDVALIETDGISYVRPLGYYEHPYDLSVRDKVRCCFGKVTPDSQTKEAEDLVTDLHIDAVRSSGFDAEIIGFHGQTITHHPKDGFTWQIGDGPRLAKETGVSVIYDMRRNDMAQGGQGAPLLPLYHQALLSEQEMPVAILNLGGVANITYAGVNGDLVAFDCGPANALMDDFIKLREGCDFDKDGRKAALGTVLDAPLKAFCADPFFRMKPPKSLDRNHWDISCVRYASTEDGMATLLEMSVSGVQKALNHLPGIPEHIYVAGGGRKNRYFIETVAQRLGIPVLPVEALGWNGDATEAEGFAYLAVRSLLGLNLTLPETTGVAHAVSGGLLEEAC